MSLQDIKDSFYVTFRDRIASLNPARILTLRGIPRPAVIVLENELTTAATQPDIYPDTFCLAWTGLAADPLGMIALTCEIRYTTAGTPGACGMDRGRALAAMDEELRTALDTAPQSTPLVARAELPGGGATSQTPAGTSLFWSSAVFTLTVPRNELLQRTATVEVFGYE